jgi:acetyl-CoA carboxylase/biotin carboxylase 1
MMTTVPQPTYVIEAPQPGTNYTPAVVAALAVAGVVYNRQGAAEPAPDSEEEDIEMPRPTQAVWNRALANRSRVSPIKAVVSVSPTPSKDADEADLELREKMWSYVKERGGNKLIRRILIANNGMAATKTIMSIRNFCYNTFGDERAIKFVVMATPDDLAANAEFIRRADEFVEVPGGSNANNYANVQLIVDLCISQNVDAVMVGWGHASENPKLGDLLKAKSAELGRSIEFVGPQSEVMRILGDKIGANLVAQSAGVSVPPWNGDGLEADLDENKRIPQKNFDAACITSEDEAVAAAERVGYPVMLKASEGGGGKGIRKANNATELRAAWPQVVNEVPGSPIFLVTLCQGARHLEVQVISDGENVIALGGRDCSTQRRYQKIFEEGPPIVADNDIFIDMMKAACSLCKTLNYRSAGTIEYLYQPETKTYYFLELNPRLQVEHPVTEGITGVSLPATQIHIAMGIPLYNVPEVRRFYDEDMEKIGKFNLDYFKPFDQYPKHVIAARITAENPDEGFKPTSGKIDRISFQSNTNVWGYFSVTADGGVHEYADSQFGHLFASGPTREVARKNLVMALKELFIMGEIRTTVEYLGELLETDAFKENTITTAWLDGLIASKDVGVQIETMPAVINAAVYRAYKHITGAISGFQDALSKGQLSTLALREMQSVPIEITYLDIKYSFTVQPKGPETIALRFNSKEIIVKYREQADGSLYVSYGDESHQLFAKEEPLGLRMVLDGVTVLLPTLYDPSELRSDVTGKLVRYLAEDGTSVKKGEPYAEMEAMKMIITLYASEAGIVTCEKQPGSIINQGDLLATLELADPSKVKKILPFDGELTYLSSGDKTETTLQAFRSSKHTLNRVMDGYILDDQASLVKMLSALSSVSYPVEEVQDAVSALGQKMPVELDALMQNVYEKTLASHVKGEDTAETAKLCAELTTTIDDYIQSLYEQKRDDMRVTLTPVTTVIDKFAGGLRENAVDEVAAILSRFLAVEQSFSGVSSDTAMSALVKANPESLETVYKAALAHEQLALRSELCNSMLRQLAAFPERFSVEPLRELPASLDVVKSLSELKGAAYAETALRASQFGLLKAEKPFSEAVADLKADLQEYGLESTAVARSVVANALIACFSDPDVGQTAMQVAIKRWYRTFKLVEMDGSEKGRVEFKYQIADKSQDPEQVYPVRYGVMAYVDDMDALASSLPSILAEYKGEGPDAVNSLHFILAKGTTNSDELTLAAQPLVEKCKDTLVAKGVRVFSVTVARASGSARLRSIFFTASSGYKEDFDRRNLHPNQHTLLELGRLTPWSPVRMPSISNNTAILLGTLGDKPRQQQRVFVRGITHTAGIGEMAAAEIVLQKSLDELQLAVLDQKVSPSSSSHLFLHVITPFDATPEVLIENWRELMSSLISKYATRLLKLRVDEIEIKGHTGTGDMRQAVRLVASSMGGQWLKTDGYLEYLDPVDGSTQAYCTVGAEEMCFVEPYPVSDALATKRSIARRIGTTYAYDFLGLIEKSLVAEWSRAVTDGRFTSIPQNLVEVEELLLEDGEIAPGTRVVGTNAVGMVGWIATLKTPEYPEGRPLAIVANDCTVQSGSFGVLEDEYFDALSKWARAKGIPRLHIACNSGARIGLAEELKPHFKVAWNDPNNEANGYEYLYLLEKDAERLGAGVNFHGEYITDGGEKRYKLEDIVGEKDGLGVENLRGSGMIAGETSAAYDETFTLSYVTGRSVGIGAYLNRLAQRVIQMNTGPMILTGYSALNKLLGKEVYVSQDQLGGPSIMLPNGVAHQLAEDDQDGVEKILRWLSYVPKTASEQVAIAAAVDPVDRIVGYSPPNTPYDPRNLCTGANSADGTFEPGFFDVGSFTEYLAEWGKSVVVGRARLGGIPMGVIAVETRLVEQVVPADPANPLSRQAVLAQAGQVWYPDSAFKTAQAIADFNAAENLPLMIFANWRGFSGGTRDMFGEVLKFGAMIVDNLRTYKHPVFAYIPPNGELRGGAWVVIDPTINEEMMEMYVDNNARGGILEPPGICDVKFRKPDLLKTMHRLDSKLQSLDAELDQAQAAEFSDAADTELKAIKDAITAREAQLMPLYVQISHEFADLHDRPGRMKAKGVIRDIVPWERAREYFFYRVRRRLLQDAMISQLKAADEALTHTECLNLLRKWMGEKASWEDDKAVIAFFESQGAQIDEKLGEVRLESVKKTVASLVSNLTDAQKSAVIDSL